MHTLAERSGFIRELLRGRADLRGYGLLLRNLLPVYARMEQALERKVAMPAFAGIAVRQVYRASAIERDLTRIFGPSWASDLSYLTAGRRYAARIGEAAAGDGHLLVAHAYVRYLGDLNGGQILKQQLSRTLGLNSDSLSFYDFDDVEDLAGFRIAYREAIDQAEHHMSATEPVVAEAAAAFQFNIELSQAIQAA